MNTENLKSKLSNKVKDITEERTIIMQETAVTNYAALKNNALEIMDMLI